RPKFLLHRPLHAVRQHNHILDVQLARVLIRVLFPLIHPRRHAFFLQHLHRAGLHHLTALAAQLDDVPVQVREVAGPAAHPRLPEAEHLFPEQFPAFSSHEGAIDALLVGVPDLRFLLADDDDEVAGLPVRALVALVLVHDLPLARHALLDDERVRGFLTHDAAAAAYFAWFLDAVALAAAALALHLHLLVDARGEHLLLDHPSRAAAHVARLHDAVGGPAALALIAHLLLLHCELVRVPRIEVAQRHRDVDFHVRPATHPAAALPEVARSAEEAREEVEGVVLGAAARGFLPVLGEAIVAVLVVDATGCGVREGFVGVGYGDKFLLGGVIAAER
ncbi:MAG: hypothetical protein Q9197_002285, partial [Variospora fuerteventurae]